MEENVVVDINDLVAAKDEQLRLANAQLAMSVARSTGLARELAAVKAEFAKHLAADEANSKVADTKKDADAIRASILEQFAKEQQERKRYAGEQKADGLVEVQP